MIHRPLRPRNPPRAHPVEPPPDGAGASLTSFYQLAGSSPTTRTLPPAATIFSRAASGFDCT